MSTPDSLDTVLERLRSLVQAETVVGKAIPCPDGSTVVPVCKVALGFAGGTGNREGRSGLGTGGGASITPVAFLVLRADRTDLVPLDKGSFQVSKLLDLVPDLLDRFAPRRDGEEGASEA